MPAAPGIPATPAISPSVRVWDPARFEKGKEVLILQGHAACPTAFFAPDDKSIASFPVNPGGVTLWSAQDGKQVRATRRDEGEYRFLCTGDVEAFRELGSRFLQMPIEQIEHVSFPLAQAA